MKISKFLNELEEVAYITDVQTDELVFLNDAGRAMVQPEDLQGKLCYRVLYGREKPCKNCTRQYLNQELYFVQKDAKTFNGELCTKKDKLIVYQNRLCHLSVHQCKNRNEERIVRNRDKLTNLLVATEGKKEIEEYLQIVENGEGVLFLIDLDDFRKINEMYGCYFGDVVIKEVGEIIENSVSCQDVVVRYGGDEFLVFRKNMFYEQAYEYANNLIQQIKKLYENDKKEAVLSCSIGMVQAEVIDTYEELVRFAECALEYAKKGAKGLVCSYIDIKDEKEGIKKKTNADKTYFYGSREKSMLQFAKNLLEKSKSLKSAVCILMAKLGREYGLTRIVILEHDYDFLCSNVIFQWRASEEFSAFSNIIELDEQINEKFQRRFADSGYFVLNGSLIEEEKSLFDFEFQNRTQLFCEWITEGQYSGMVIYECEEQGAGWPGEICQVLYEISNMIETYRKRDMMNKESKEKAEFLSGISHEIRTPMNAINGWTNIARQYIGNQDKMQEYLEKIEISSKYLLSVMDELLELENMESGHFKNEKEIFSLQECLLEIQDLFIRQYGIKNKKCYFVNECIQDKYVGDKKHIQQVLVNILDYMSKNTEENAAVTLNVLETKQEMLCFSIESTGECDKIPEVMRFFEQIEDNFMQEQIGDIDFRLFISFRLVKCLNGRIECSKNESGWMIRVSLPIESGYEEELLENNIQYNFEGKKLLLVEDNDLNVEVAQTLLEMVGFEVDVAKNGMIAVEKFNQEEPGSYDAILMDIRMPIMDGLEATRRIRNLGKEDSRTVSIVALSANAHDEDAKKSIANGMNGHLAKPIQVNCLYNMLQQLIC